MLRARPSPIASRAGSRADGFARVGAAAAVACVLSALACSQPEHLGVDHSSDTGPMGYCRTTTCPPPSDYPTRDGMCEPAGWSDSDTCAKAKASNAPLWWRTACVGYDLNESASRRVPLDAFSRAAAAAFDAWTSAECTPQGAGPARPSIAALEREPVSCAKATYDPAGPNQSVIVFHDDAWPYEARDRAQSGSLTSLTLALTTVTFDPTTGELYDADIEINSADWLIEATPTSASSNDLQAILTHEAGHFFGLAHSPLPDAVMYATGDASGAAPRRALTEEDARGMCVIYPPGGTRVVSAIVDASGKTSAGSCDPTPRHGFKRTCG